LIDKSINDLKVYADTSAYSERKRLSLAGFSPSLLCRQMCVNREARDLPHPPRVYMWEWEIHAGFIHHASSY
jgi:hypothetical protein